MGLMDRVKKRVKQKIESFSGDYSKEAPEERPDYARPGVRNDDVEVQMAIIHGVGGRKNVYSKDREKTYEQKPKVVEGKEDPPSTDETTD